MKKSVEEFWTLVDTEWVGGPFATIDSAKRSFEDWELRRDDIRILRTVTVAETQVTYTTKWNDLPHNAG